MVSFRRILLIFIGLVILTGGLLLRTREMREDSPDVVASRLESSPGQSQPARPTTTYQPASSSLPVPDKPLQPDASPSARPLSELMSWSPEGLVEVNHPEGHSTIDLAGRFTHMSAGYRDASGNLVIQCFTDHQSLGDAVTRGQPVLPFPDNPPEYEVSDF